MSPYPGVSKSKTAKLDRCVQRVMAKGVKKFKGRSKKSSAVAICRKSMGV